MQEAEDSLVLDLAAREDRILVSADTDFGTLLSLRRESKPSVVLIRRGSQRRPSEQTALLLVNLPVIADALASGCIAVIDNERLRVRALPLMGMGSPR
jgi:predicted nuclease of predicted toxin-antitoxin system